MRAILELARLKPPTAGLKSAPRTRVLSRSVDRGYGVGPAPPAYRHRRLARVPPDQRASDLPDGASVVYTVATPDRAGNTSVRNIWIVPTAGGAGAAAHRQRQGQRRAVVAGRQAPRLRVEPRRRRRGLHDAAHGRRARAAHHPLRRRRQHRLVARQQVDRVHVADLSRLQGRRVQREAREGGRGQQSQGARHRDACSTATGRSGETASADTCSSCPWTAGRRRT